MKPINSIIIDMPFFDDLPYRKVSAHNRVWHLPRHVNAIPSGWQVRFARKSEEYYSKAYSIKDFKSSELALRACLLDLRGQLSKRARTESVIGHRKSALPPQLMFWHSKGRLAAALPLFVYKGKNHLIYKYSLPIGHDDFRDSLENALCQLIGRWQWACQVIKQEGVDILQIYSKQDQNLDRQNIEPFTRIGEKNLELSLYMDRQIDAAMDWIERHPLKKQLL